MKVTIKDVARAAGVSPSTVSRALHDNDRISPEVRSRVKQVAQDMNFHPNLMARSLVNRQTRIIGVVFPEEAGLNLRNPFYPEVLQGLGHAAGQRRYQILLLTGAPGVSSQEICREAVDAGYVSGLILLTAKDMPPVEYDVPVVTIGHPVDAERRCYVDNDNVHAGYAAASHLLAHGHRRVLFVGYDSSVIFTVDRRKGVEKALAEASLALPDHWVLPGTADSARLESLFAQPDAPTAAVCVDDLTAIRLSRQLSAMGRSVPGDLSLISFNNNESSHYHVPPLTTFDVAPYQLGSNAMKLMLNMLDGTVTEPTAIDVPFTLIERYSVADLR